MDELGFEQALPDISLGSTDFENELKVAAGNDSDFKNSDLETSTLNTRTSKNKTSNKKLSTFQKACGCLTINYWSEYFEISQTELKNRILATLNPIKPTLADRIEDKPDLYGPFWMCTTLIFMLLISESLWDVMKNMLTDQASRNTFNFNQIGLAVGLVYGAFFAFPLAFVLVNKFLGSHSSVIKCACIYGYSILALVVASILSILPVSGLRYLFWILAGVHSIAVLFTNLKGQIALFQGNARMGIIVFIGFFQLFIMGAILTNFYISPIGTDPNAIITPVVTPIKQIT